MEEPLVLHCHTNASILLSREQGAVIESLIYKETGCRMSSYSINVGISDSNISAYLNGRKKITFQTLEKLLSGLPNYSVLCETKFVIQKDIGTDVTNVDYPNIEDQLFFEEMVMSMGKGQSKETDTRSTGEVSQPNTPNPISSPLKTLESLQPGMILSKEQMHLLRQNKTVTLREEQSSASPPVPPSSYSLEKPPEDKRT